MVINWTVSILSRAVRFLITLAIASVSVERPHLKQNIGIPHHKGLRVTHVTDSEERTVIILSLFIRNFSAGNIPTVGLSGRLGA